MLAPIDIRGWFPVPKTNTHPARGPWVGFVVEQGAVIDPDAAEVRGFQGLFREPEPGVYVQDTSEAFVVPLTAEDVAMIRGILEAREAALGIAPTRTYNLSLGGGGIDLSFGSVTYEPTDLEIQQIMGIVLMRAKALDTMGVYDDPEWPPGSEIEMRVNGQAV